MWKWIKKLLTKKPKEVQINISKLTKGDLKKLKAQGKIKNIYERH